MNIRTTMQAFLWPYCVALLLSGISLVALMESDDVLSNENFIRNHGFTHPHIYNSINNSKDHFSVLLSSSSSPKSTSTNVTRTVGSVLQRRTPILFAHPTANNIQCNTSSVCNLQQCTESVWEFPYIFNKEQLQNGALVIVIIVGAYCFTLIAVICDSYFLPCVQELCDTFKISQDVAAAVFMSMATSTPELFTNVIGTFITESDIGLGAIVGSSMFNTLGVAALGSLAASKSIKLDWWPLCRDVVIYITAILMLVTMTWDGVVQWWEAFILTIVYFVYFIIMFQNKRISKFFRNKFSRTKSKNIKQSSVLSSSIKEDSLSNPMYVIGLSDEATGCTKKTMTYIKTEKELVCQYITEEGNCSDEIDNKSEPGNETIFKRPTGKWYQKCMFFFLWPSKFLLQCSIPDPAKYPHLYPITFIMCIVWIAFTSYIVSWMVTLIGYTLTIPDSILGLTFLAAGGCLPEAISIIIMSRKGEGSMGVSNALGANTMNILLSLGVPWFIKATFVTPSVIKIESGSIEYTILALIIAALFLFITLALNGFRLSRRAGVILGLMYTLFIVLAILSELVFFENNVCSDLK